MALKINPFSNQSGGNVLYKALAHPLCMEKLAQLRATHLSSGRCALFDPDHIAESVFSLLNFEGVNWCAVFGQKTEKIGQQVGGLEIQPLTALNRTQVDTLFVLRFDAERTIDQLHSFIEAHQLETAPELISLDELKLPPAWLSDQRRYLNPLNFITNFALFRDEAGQYTRLSTVNYWSDYGAKNPLLHAILFDQTGRELCRFERELGTALQSIELDSRDIRREFDLPEFCGQLFLQISHGAGHDVLKYALDFDDAHHHSLSCTHDANAWPSKRYSGLPLPVPGEQVILWLQNPHPVKIPAGSIQIQDMQGHILLSLDSDLAPFASYPLCLPDSETAACTQVMVDCGYQLIRPRYEVNTGQRRRIAHVNVYREDLNADQDYRNHELELGSGYMLTAPVLDPEEYKTEFLVTPMSPAQNSLCLNLSTFGHDGTELHDQKGRVQKPEQHQWQSVQMGQSGHIALTQGSQGHVDGWFHAIFRYKHLSSNHSAETSFGCHMFNSIMTYKKEPQSYAGPSPGLSTRLYLRLGPRPLETLLCLIYPTSTQWLAKSETQISLKRANGSVVAETNIQIALQGSFQGKLGELFDSEQIAQAGERAYVMIRDNRCRLFGYHGLSHTSGGFSLDHLFGF